MLLSKGGMNFFSKNFELVMILRNFLTQTTDSLLNNPQIVNLMKEENFSSIRVFSSQNNLNLSKSLYENPLISQINNIIINLNNKIDPNDDFIVKINFLQLRYLLELQFVVRIYI